MRLRNDVLSHCNEPACNVTFLMSFGFGEFLKIPVEISVETIRIVFLCSYSNCLPMQELFVQLRNFNDTFS